MSDGGSRMYLESNKPEAERCVDLALDEWKRGDLIKAHRFLQKSLKLYPTTQAQALIAKLLAEAKQAEERQRKAAEQRAEQEAEEAAHRARERERQQREAQYRQQQQQQQQRQQQQQQQQQQHGAGMRHRNTSQNNSSSPSPSPSSSTSPPSSSDGSSAARALIAKKDDYYAILNVSRGATEVEIKKSYRKLALVFHPDKNKAPEAEEAFKLVNSAFQCLSDPVKRRHYDAYGSEDPQQAAAAAQAQRYQQWNRDDDLTPEDVFNMFFNGGMGMGSGPRRTYTFRRQTRAHYHQAAGGGGGRGMGADDSPAAIFAQFAHFIPLILLLLFGLLSAPGGHDEPAFNLDRSSSHPIARHTQQSKVPYYVNHQFAYTHQRDQRALAQVEYMVEQKAFKMAEEECRKQKRGVAEAERRAKKDLRGAVLSAKLQELESKPLKACERLRKYQMNAHAQTGGGG